MWAIVRFGLELCPAQEGWDKARSSRSQTAGKSLTPVAVCTTQNPGWEMGLQAAPWWGALPGLQRSWLTLSLQRPRRWPRVPSAQRSLSVGMGRRTQPLVIHSSPCSRHSPCSAAMTGKKGPVCLCLCLSVTVGSKCILLVPQSPDSPQGQRALVKPLQSSGGAKDWTAAFSWPWSAAVLQLQQVRAVSSLCLLLHGAAKEILREERKLWDKTMCWLKPEAGWQQFSV